MPRQVAVHQLEDLTHRDSKNEILLDTQLNTQLHVEAKSDLTIIHLPYGNRVDLVNNRIIIHEK